MRAAAAETISLSSDVVVTTGAPILAALQSETKTIPLVFTFVTDPVSDGFVVSLTRPGGNITGFTIFDHSFAGKWLEMLKEVVPSMTRVAVMQKPDHPAWTAYLRAIGTIAPRIGVEVTPTPVSNVVDIAPARDARKQLQEQLDSRTCELAEARERQPASAEVLRVISTSPNDVQPVFDAIAESAVRLCQGQFSFVLRLDRVLCTLALAMVSRLKGWKHFGGSFRDRLMRARFQGAPSCTAQSRRSRMCWPIPPMALSVLPEG
jgi:ABC transporter substrate binding protein